MTLADVFEATRDAQAVVGTVTALDEVGVNVWLDGGWGVGALLEVQTREHRKRERVVVTSGEVVRGHARWCAKSRGSHSVTH